MTNEEIIEEVLYKAYEIGISQEVRIRAQEYMNAGERCKACAYQMAFNKLTSAAWKRGVVNTKTETFQFFYL